MTHAGPGGDVVWWAALGEIPGLGAAGMLRLARRFGSPQAALSAPQQELVTRGGLTRAQAEHAMALPSRIDALRRAIRDWNRDGIGLLSVTDPAYPRGLLGLRSPPPLLYVRGCLQPHDARAVAIVGSRTPSAEGLKRAEALAHGFASRGFTIVSGLARGIDAAAHAGSLSTPSGRTLAVLGCGLLRIYPPENAGLALQIAGRGALLAEVPPTRSVEGRLLLARDRLQAGLARAVIVVQAHRECGSIVTARHASRCGRLLLGVPWEEPPFSEGWKRLRELGAYGLPPDGDLGRITAAIEAWSFPQPQTGLAGLGR